MAKQPKKGLPNPLCEIFGGCEYKTICVEEGCVYTQPVDLEDFKAGDLNILKSPDRFSEELRYRLKGRLGYDRIEGMFQSLADERMSMVGLGE